MYNRQFFITVLLCILYFLPISRTNAYNKSTGPSEPPSKIYVPYRQLKSVFEKEQQGVFLPYSDFQKLWRAAQGKPADISEAPFEYLISTARFNGKVDEVIASIRLELTIDVLSDDWVQVPLGLGEVAVSQATVLDKNNTEVDPLLQVIDGQYIFTVRGAGRYVLMLNFVRQIETQPGLAVLKYHLPSASITTLELLIPEENLKVDIEPMLAATTSKAKMEQFGATRLQAFLGPAQEVRLSWKPKTQAAEELEPVIICEQFRHVNIDEALISQEVILNYNIHRGGVTSLSVYIPSDFRITDVNGVNIAKWDIETVSAADGKQGSQLLNVNLFSAAKDKYTLSISMEKFLQENQLQMRLNPIITERVFRQSGLIGITYSPRRTVHLEDVKNLARVDTGQLPANLQNRTGVTAYRFITADYSGSIIIETTLPRIAVNQRWILGIDNDLQELRGRIHYRINRTGIFELDMNLPEPWRITSLGPEELVDDYQLKGRGQSRKLHILLKREKIGEFELMLVARSNRVRPDESVDFRLPLPDANNLQSYQGQLLLSLADHLQADVQEVEQLQSIPLGQARQWTSIADLSPVMAFDFRAIDRNEPSGGRFNVTVKPVQISATVHRLVNIQPGSIEHEAIVQYRIRYAPVDTFYLMMPTPFAESGVEITGDNIKEKPRIDELPTDQRVDVNQIDEPGESWAYYKVVLQSKVMDNYQLRIHARHSFQAAEAGRIAIVEVPQILAAGKLSDQNGHIAVAKADTLAIGEPVVENLVPADVGSTTDLPYESHRRSASLAFKYNTPSYALTLPVVLQEEATVFTTIVDCAVVEQVLSRDGMLNTHTTYLLATSKGERLPVILPEGAELTAVLLNGDEAPVEVGTSSEERIVRLPPSAGQVSRFILEISYGLEGTSASRLAAPELPSQVPIQQTLWRLWIPEGYYFLGHDKVFSQISDSRSRSMLRSLQTPRSDPINFKLSGQGTVLSFVRQGPPEQLSVLAVGKEFFSVIVWILIIAAGVLMLKLSGYQRLIVILALGTLAGIIHLYLPVLVIRVLRVGGYAIFIVILLWTGQWLFIRLPKLQQKMAAGRQAKLDKKQEKVKPDKENSQKSPDSKKSLNDQSKQEQE
jgi:hypothetical protein